MGGSSSLFIPQEKTEQTEEAYPECYLPALACGGPPRGRGREDESGLNWGHSKVRGNGVHLSVQHLGG